MEKYNLLMRIMHFIMAFLIVVLLSVGVFMTNMPDGEDKWKIYFMHKSFGALVLLLAFLRWTIRSNSKLPELPEEINRAEAKASKLGHYSLYLFMFLVPITGLLMSVFSGRGAPFFTAVFLTDLTKNDFIVLKSNLGKSGKIKVS